MTRLNSVVITCLMFAVTVAIGCGARTGLRVPDAPQRQVLSCDSTHTARLMVNVVPDPVAPSGVPITSVHWNIGRRCVDGSGGVAYQGCDATTAPRGNTEWGGDCMGSQIFFVPSNTFASTDSNVGFELQGQVAGSICVSGTVNFSNGHHVDLPPRTWPEMNGRFINMTYWNAINPADATTPLINPSMSTTPGCPTH